MFTHAPLHCEVVRQASPSPTDTAAPATIPARTPQHESDANRRVAAGQRARVLIVEDGLIVAEDFRRRCEALGYRIAGVLHTGEEAVEAAEKSRPDVVLMDIGLRGTMDGIEAARHIRDRTAIPIVFATAYSDESTLDRAKKTQPAGFLLKPVGARELRAAIEVALVSQLSRQQLRDHQDRYRILVEAVSDGVLVVDASGSIVECSLRAAQFLGNADAHSMIGRDVLDLLPAGDRDRFAEFLHEAISTGMALRQTWGITADGGCARAISFDVHPLPDPSRTGPSALLLLRIR
jgi:PAS domain S-box-containing protein